MFVWVWENKKVLMVHYQDFFVFPWECIKVLLFSNHLLVCRQSITGTFLFSHKIFKINRSLSTKYKSQVINMNSENASSRKMENWNWFSQPLFHTVIGRTRGWENPFPVIQHPGKDTHILFHTKFFIWFFYEQRSAKLWMFSLYDLWYDVPVQKFSMFLFLAVAMRNQRMPTYSRKVEDL